MKLPRWEARHAPAAVASGAVLFAIVYALLFLAIGRASAPAESTFVSGGTMRPLYVYVELISMSAARGVAQIRFSFANDRGDHGTRFSGTPDRDVLIDVSDGDTEQRIRLRNGELMQALDFPADLDGSVGSYPVDRYSTALYLRAYEGQRADAARVIPLHVTIWEGLDDWQATATERADNPGAYIALSVRRATPIVFFGLVIYLVMALIASSSLVIGSLVFLRRRKVEATLTGALAAMLFALPAMREVLPGAPPLGVAADILVFLWAEVAVAVGLSLFVWTWATGDVARPP
jgi:hypothetical protein